MGSNGRARHLRALGRSPVWAALALACAAVLLYPWVRGVVLGVEETAAVRGRAVAVRAGCFACHGPDGTGGVKNPGSEDGEVPGFAGGTPMMWAKSEDELREYVLDGAPARKRNDPAYRTQMAKQLLRMPAYGGFLSAQAVDDLLAYLRAVSGLVVPPDDGAATGQELAYRYGCFHCHGPMGAGGVENPGSLKGYVPGWWGDDFRDLVRDDDELEAWIRHGEIPRLREHAIAPYFIRRQRLSMPAYEGFLTDAQVRALGRYVRWVNAGDWQGTPLDLGH